MYVEQIRDTIAEPRYDTVPLPAAGSTQLTFFALPLGQGATAFGAGSKTYADTNMELAGQLPNPYTFTILGMRLAFAWNFPNADLQVAINGCVFGLFIGAKPFLRVPARTIPSGNGPFVSGNGVAGLTQTVANSGWPHMANGFAIGRKPLVLTPTENFQVQLSWPGGVQAVSAIAPLTVYLDGILRRGAQ